MSSRLRVTYRPNPAYDEARSDVPRLFATLSLRGFGVDESIAALPISFRRLSRAVGPMRETYRTCVAGLPVERGNLNALEQTLELYLGALIHFGRLPAYLFQVGTRAWPIYRLPDQLVTRYPGCPVFSARDIGRLRTYLADYFKGSGEIRNRKELGILALSRTDLQLVPPLVVYRASGIEDIPAFPEETAAGTFLVAPVNSHALRVPLASEMGILLLHQRLTDYLVEKERLADPGDLTARKLTVPTWTRLRARLDTHNYALTYYDDDDDRLQRRQVPIFANHRYLVAARTNHLQRTALHLAHDVYTLKDRLGAELHREGKLSSPTYVTLTRNVRPEVTFSA
jgi:hypothetical protein